MSWGPRKRGVCKWSEYITHSLRIQFSRIHRSFIFYLKNTKFAVEVPAYKGRLHSKKNEANCASHFRDTSEQSFFAFFFFFSHKHKSYSNSGLHTSIKLKFGTHVGLSKANICTNVGQKNLVVISNNCRKQWSICWPAYKVNCWLEWAENRYVAGLMIRGVPFGGYKSIVYETTEIWSLTQAWW